MEVYYGKNYWDHKKEGAPLKKITVQKDAGRALPTEKSLSDREALLTWGKADLFIPAVYVGRAGVAFDLCKRVKLSEIRDFLRTYQLYKENTGKDETEFSEEENNSQQSEKLRPDR